MLSSSLLLYSEAQELQFFWREDFYGALKDVCKIRFYSVIRIHQSKLSCSHALHHPRVLSGYQAIFIFMSTSKYQRFTNFLQLIIFKREIKNLLKGFEFTFQLLSPSAKRNRPVYSTNELVESESEANKLVCRLGEYFCFGLRRAIIFMNHRECYLQVPWQPSPQFVFPCLQNTGKLLFIPNS
jgi:hypothetical protein